ncbi:MAG: DEAD/DEAH box helicase [Myxococcota bacterium]
MSVELRPYQRDAIDAILTARREGTSRMVVCLPTGTGKTVIFAELARRARHPVLVLAHRAELLAQARDKIARALGDDRAVSIEQGAARAPADARVVVASIRSLHEERLGAALAGRDLRLVIYDECHHAAAPDNVRVLRQLGAFEPGWPGTLVGFTATTERGDGLGLDTVFERIVFRRGLPEMIAQEYLSPLRGFRVTSTADLREVSTWGDDFDPDELAEAVDIESRNALVARSILELARDRRTLVFCVTVAHARNLARVLNGIGVPTGIVYGEMPAPDRARTLAQFRAGELRAVTNVGVLTEGFDDPGVSAVAMARPTRSAGLYQQCVGRGTRLSPGKRDCVVLDFVDLSELSLVSLPTLFGMPRDLDLDGQDAADAGRRWAELLAPTGLEVSEATALTLAEIKQRLAAFDPLTAQVDPELTAISNHAWISLGAAGLALQYLERGAVRTYAVLDGGGARGKRYRVLHDGEEVARFSRVEDAVEAVDHEVEARGPAAAASALPDARWRAAAVAPATAQALGAPDGSLTEGEAHRRLAWRQWARPGRHNT